MEILGAVWNYLIPFLVIFTVVVFVHEMGHYLIARRCGVRVEVFSIGIGTEIFARTDRHGTRWRIGAVPVGGYVKMRGEMQPLPDASDPARQAIAGTEEKDDDSFETKTVMQRALIVAGGPLANFVLAIVLLAGMFATLGQPYTPADVGEVLPDSAAERAGFQPGDLITGIDGTRIERFEEVVQVVQLHPATALEFRLIRDGRQITLTAVPDIVDRRDRFGNPMRIGRLGISRGGGDTKLVRHDPFTAVWRATGHTFSLVGSIFSSIGQIIDGRRTTEELGGPIRIAKISGDVWQTGFLGVLTFVVLLSINLGLVNLLPIPMLDGGHLVFYAVEALRGRPLGAKAQEFGLRLGLGMVLALMVFATWNDLVQLRVIDFLVGLAT